MKTKPDETTELYSVCDGDQLIRRELAQGAFPDERLGKRLELVLQQFSDGTAESVPLACQDWANTKAAYRFFANDRVTEEDILGGHFRSTRERFGGVDGPMLVLHDTTQLSYRRDKSGCRVEKSRLRTAERLVRLLAVCCILSWRIFWMTMINRTQPEALSTVALTQPELDLLDQLFPASPTETPLPRSLGLYIGRIARLGGYLARARDPDPGNIVIWCGLARLNDLTLGYALGRRFVGN